MLRRADICIASSYEVSAFYSRKFKGNAQERSGFVDTWKVATGKMQGELRLGSDPAIYWLPRRASASRRLRKVLPGALSCGPGLCGPCRNIVG
jgi:hypothetical protein